MQACWISCREASGVRNRVCILPLVLVIYWIIALPHPLLLLLLLLGYNMLLLLFSPRIDSAYQMIVLSFIASTSHCFKLL